MDEDVQHSYEPRNDYTDNGYDSKKQSIAESMEEKSPGDLTSLIEQKNEESQSEIITEDHNHHLDSKEPTNSQPENFIDELEEFQRIEEGINSEVDDSKATVHEEQEPEIKPTPGLQTNTLDNISGNKTVQVGEKVRLNKKRKNNLDLAQGFLESLRTSKR